MEKLGKRIMRISGIVKEVRTFGGYVILFITASAPRKMQGKLIRFTVTAYNCRTPLEWVRLVTGDEVLITRTVNQTAANEVSYALKVEKTSVIDANYDLDV